MQWEPRRVLVGALVILGFAAATAIAQDAIITGTDGPDVIPGTPAGESIYARGGNDTVNGAGGNDELDGGPGADVLNGGPGSDSVAYAGAGVSVTLDGVANDGAAGEGDNVGSDVEDIFGTDSGDRLTGSSAANTIDGGDGEDRIVGGRGKDAIFGEGGDDVIEARDGQIDRIDCGAGSGDVATIDRNDVTSRCETENRPPRSDDVTLLSRRRLLVGSIDRGSALVIGCAKGCHPSLSPSTALFRRTSVRGPVVTFRLPGRVSGATLELGVTLRGASSCTRFRIGKGFRSFRFLKGQGCTTVARARRS